jgi:hypothetical protein
MGQTPAKLAQSGMRRPIGAKGKAARFNKTDRSQFTATG